MHTMTLIREHEGTEEWVCSTCGRHMLVNWHPKFKRTVLNAGDSSVGHSGFKGEAQMADMVGDTTVEGASKSEELHIPIDESRLSPWATWMDKTDFSDLWNDSVQ